MLSVASRELFKAVILKGAGVIMTQQVAGFFLPKFPQVRYQSTGELPA